MAVNHMSAIAHTGQEGPTDSLELEFEMLARHHVDAEYQKRVQ